MAATIEEGKSRNSTDAKSEFEITDLDLLDKEEAGEKVLVGVDLFKRWYLPTVLFLFSLLHLAGFSTVFTEIRDCSSWFSRDNQGWKFISCQELRQVASWLLIGYTRVNNQ